MSNFDKEYSTQFKEEFFYLREKGIRYTYAYTDDNGITTWKYKKTVELFAALLDFYSKVYYK